VAGETILIVDDSVQSREFLIEQVLKPGGYTPLECDHFEAGVQLAAERSPDLVVLATHTPGFDRPHLLTKFRTQKRSIPVILTTMRRADPRAAAMLRAGVCDVLVKPLKQDEAARVIERALAEVRLRRERDDLANKLAEMRRQMEWQLQEFNALYTIGKAVAAVLNPEQVLPQVVEIAVNMTRAEEGSLLLLDETTGELYLRAAKNIDQRTTRGLRVRVEDSLLGRVVKSGRPVLMAGPELQKISTSYLSKALLYVPLKVPPDRIIGVMGVANKVSNRAFTERDVFLLSALGDHAAIAIENARLFAAVESERSKLEAVLRGTEDAVIVLDQDRHVLLINPAARKAFNIETPTVTGRTLLECIHSQTLLDWFKIPPGVGQPTRTEVPLTDGRTLQAQISAIEGIGYAVVMQDITHLKELDRIKSEFVSVVSHDIRSPLTTIRGYMELLERVGPLTPQQAEFVKRIERSMTTITELIGDLLDIGRLEAGLDQEAAPCELERIVMRGIEAVQMTAEERHQTLSWDIASGLPSLLGNARRLEQVVTNLLSNAIKYTPGGGKIELTLKTAGAYLMLRVRDNGIGIPLEDQPHVFEKFYRVQNEATADIGGTGLGLSIVKSVVERHSGRIWVESEPGQGSTFTVLLPIQPRGMHHPIRS
jgi:two-component system NtrC family sensor kinase